MVWENKDLQGLWQIRHSEHHVAPVGCCFNHHERRHFLIQLINLSYDEPLYKCGYIHNFLRRHTQYRRVYLHIRSRGSFVSLFFGEIIFLKRRHSTSRNLWLCSFINCISTLYHIFWKPNWWHCKPWIPLTLRRERYLVYELLPGGDVHSRLNKDLRHSFLSRNVEIRRLLVWLSPYTVQFAETPKEHVQKLEHRLVLFETLKEQPNDFAGNEVL